MMKEQELANQVALVTGASSGLGVDFARQLAARGASLVLVARRADQLRAVASEIEKEYKVPAQAIVMDLAEPGAPQALHDQLRQGNTRVDVLVNNAGFGIYGDFAEVPWEREKAMLDIDVITLTHMTKLFIQDMLARKSGYILQVASIGAYQPSPTYATYSAAKAYVLMMGEALNYELRHSGVSVTVVSPGVTATEFLKVSGQSPSLYQRMMMMESADVARIGIESMLRRRPSVIPGLMNSLAAFSTRLMPRRMQAAIAYLSMTRR
jgi:short-subunit dehydrogenase